MREELETYREAVRRDPEDGPARLRLALALLDQGGPDAESSEELLAELRDETPPAERWDPTAHGQTETGRI